MITIYIIKNNFNDMIYIGQTSLTLQERFAMHKKPSNINKSNSLLHKDMQEHGYDKFTITEIDTCEERHKYIIEKYWIEKYIDEGFPMYNIMLANDLNAKQRWSQMRLNNGFDYQSDEFKGTMSSVTKGKNNGMYGKKGKNAVNGQRVYALNEDMEIVHEFVSVSECLTFLGLKSHKKLNESCRNGQKYKGFYWKKQWKRYAK